MPDVIPDRRSVLVSLVAGTASVAIPVPASAFWDQLSSFLVSDDQIRAMGLATWNQIQTDLPPSKDKALQERLERIGRRVVGASGTRQQDWEFLVFESDQVNAFAVPGGKVGFYEGIFAAMDNDDQVATVMGHEIGHIEAEHVRERIGTEMATQLGQQALAWALQAGQVSFANEIAAVLGLGVQYGVILPYSRSQEYEADRLGVQYMAQAGYAPDEAVSFWRNMIAASAGTSKPPAFLSTHPSDDARVAELKALMPTMRPIYEANRQG